MTNHRGNVAVVAKKRMEFVHTLEEMPKCNHYAIITFGSTWTPPYDAHDTGSTSPAVEYYQWTDDRAVWEAEIRSLMESKFGSKSFCAIEVKVPKITTEIKIDIG